MIIYILLQIYSTLDYKLSARPRQRVKGLQCDGHLTLKHPGGMQEEAYGALEAHAKEVVIVR